MKDLYCWRSKFKSCTYSDKLINKIISLNKLSNDKVNLTEIKKAIYYAKKYHSSQIRLSGEPYYTHPLIIAEMVADHVFKTDILVVSILHDTIEDTDLTKDMIEHIFDLNIANKVNDLTRNKNGIKTSSAELLESLWLQKKEELLIVKFFDRLHNMQTIKSQSPEKKLSITKETFEKFVSLSMYLRSRLLNFKTDIDITTLCYQQLTPHQFYQTISLMKSCQEHFDLPSPFFRNTTIHTKIL